MLCIVTCVSMERVAVCAEHAKVALRTIFCMVFRLDLCHILTAHLMFGVHAVPSQITMTQRLALAPAGAVGCWPLRSSSVQHQLEVGLFAARAPDVVIRL